MRRIVKTKMHFFCHQNEAEKCAIDHKMQFNMKLTIHVHQTVLVADSRSTKKSEVATN